MGVRVQKPKRRVTDAPLLIVAILVYAKDALTADVFADRPTSPCIVGADEDGQLFMFLPRMAKVKDFDLTVVFLILFKYIIQLYLL